MQTAKEIMTTDVITIAASVTVAEAMQTMSKNNLRDLVVQPASAGDSHGMITEADIVYKVAAEGLDPASVSVGEIMTQPCIEVDPNMTVQEVAGLFANHHLNRAPVIKDDLLGVVTAFDIVRETMWWQG